MEGEKVREFFCKIIKEDEDVSVGVAAIRTLMEIIKHSKSETVQELEANLKDGIQIMKSSNYPVAAINSGCELFLRFITLAVLDTRTFDECKTIMLNRGHIFIKKLDEARGKIVKLAAKFIEDGSKVLTHSRSRVVLQTLRKAHKQNKRFEVFITISAPDNSGQCMCKDLESEGIPCTLILDSAIGYIMEQVNFIMVGAEGVVESGGIVNKEFDELVDTLLCKTADSNKFIRHDANLALDCMVTHLPVFHVVRGICCKGPEHKNHLVRTASARLLVCAVVIAGPQNILHPNNNEYTRKRIILSMVKFLDDKNMETRKFGERLYKLLYKDRIFDVYLRRYLEREMIVKIKKLLKGPNG